MYFIRPCPSCGQKIRFPIDRGKIKVTCSCGFSFIADPDDPSLFREGVFDLEARGGDKKTVKPSLFSMVRSLDPPRIKRRVITSLYDYWYHVQNFRLLPDSEKRRTVMQGVLVIIVFIFILYMIFYYFSKPSSVPEYVI